MDEMMSHDNIHRTSNLKLFVDVWVNFVWMDAKALS